MDVIETILLIIGISCMLIGYFYNKTYSSKKKPKIPNNYMEYIGICKKHIEKNGKICEMFEIAYGDKTLKYCYSSQDSKEKLHKIDSIEKFYIDNNNPKIIKTAADFSDGIKALNKTRRNISYAITGAGLLCIVAVLVKLAF